MAQKTFNDTKINVKFDEATSRQQLNSGENISTLFGKIKKFFSDLKAICFSGSYNDLSDTPTTATTDSDGLMSASDKSKLDSADDTYALKSLYGDTTINVGRKAGTDVGEYSTAEGIDTTASGTATHAEGAGTIANGARCHAEGLWTIASGSTNHAEGTDTTANGNNSCHAEGRGTTASGIATHAEGNSSNKVTDLITDFSWNGTTNDDIINAWNTQKFSIAHGRASHVEGHDNLSLGYSSHAEGYSTVAIGDQSHTSGKGTKALHDNEAAYGTYNKSNGDTLFSIGDGTADDARHNAFEITTTGGKLHDKDIATTDLIPTELPANGGNAETVGGKSASDFVEALTLSQSANTRVIIPDNVDVTNWLIENAKIGTVYYINQNSQGQTNLPPVANISWVWFSFDGNRYLARAMINDFSTRDFLLDKVNSIGGWKEISTTPIKSTTVNGSTDSYGSLLLWSISGSIPIAAVGDENRIFSPFIGSGNNYYLAVRDLAGNAVTITTASATVFFI